MKRVCVSNNGEIENGAFALLGASTKEEQDKIGFFGSGNKYAIATLLRKGIPFRVFSGTKEIIITTVPIAFGGQTYNQIFIDDVPTSFTTRMGPTWEAWFALREIICNAIDEGDYTVDFICDDTEVQGVEGTTRVYVDLIDDLCTFDVDYTDYFIVDQEPIHSIETKYGSTVSIYPNQNNEFIVFRKGVRITVKEDKRKALYKYNFSSIDINESRLIQYDFQATENIASFMGMCKSVDVLRRYMANCNNPDLIEYGVSWRFSTYVLTEEWREAIGSNVIMPRAIAENMPVEDLFDSYTVPDELAKIIAETFPDIVVYGSSNKQYETVEVKDDIKERANNAIAECVSFGLDLKDYTVEFARFYRDSVMAHCDLAHRVIRLSVKCMDDYDELVAIVYEEMSHIEGYVDGTRQFEQHLMRLLVKAHRRINELEG